jgi:hypothetical protein
MNGCKSLRQKFLDASVGDQHPPESASHRGVPLLTIVAADDHSYPEGNKDGD